MIRTLKLGDRVQIKESSFLDFHSDLLDEDYRKVCDRALRLLYDNAIWIVCRLDEDSFAQAPMVELQLEGSKFKFPLDVGEESVRKV